MQKFEDYINELNASVGRSLGQSLNAGNGNSIVINNAALKQTVFTLIKNRSGGDIQKANEIARDILEIAQQAIVATATATKFSDINKGIKLRTSGSGLASRARAMGQV